MTTNRARCAANAIKTASLFVQDDEFKELSYFHTKLRLETLEENWTKFEFLSEDLLDVVAGKDLPNLMEEIEATRVDYFVAKAALQERMAETCSPAQSQISTADENLRHDLTETCGEFDGTYTKWIDFRGRFKAAIHDNENISPSLKFLYLKKSLVRDAANALDEWQLTEENYNEAWECLNKMYHKKYLIGRDHLRQLIDLPELRERPSAVALQTMAISTYEAMRQLKALGLPVEHWDFFVVHILNEKLDPETARQWELQRDSDQPKLATMLAFIENEAAALLNVASAQQRGARQGHRPHVQATISTGTKRRGVDKLCEMCGEYHRIWECPDFASLHFRDRQDFIDRRPICPNCLKHGHKENNCFTRGCVRCPGSPKHNIFLCPSKVVNKPAYVREKKEAASSSAAMQRSNIGLLVKVKREVKVEPQQASSSKRKYFDHEYVS